MSDSVDFSDLFETGNIQFEFLSCGFAENCVKYGIRQCIVNNMFMRFQTVLSVFIYCVVVMFNVYRGLFFTCL